MYALSMTKSRLSVTVDADLIAAVQAAVAAGAAESTSAWVSDALRLKLDHDRRLRGIGDFIAAYEAEHGEITEEEWRAHWPRVQPTVGNDEASDASVRKGRKRGRKSPHG